VPAARMMQVEAVIAEFQNLDNRMDATRQFHPRFELSRLRQSIENSISNPATGWLTALLTGGYGDVRVELSQKHSPELSRPPDQHFSCQCFAEWRESEVFPVSGKP
jgi:hypothetical protein